MLIHLVGGATFLTKGFIVHGSRFTLVRAVGSIKKEIACPVVRERVSLPITQVLVETLGTPKHVRHASDLGYLPASNVLVKLLGTYKHETRGFDFGSSPVSDVAVEC